MDSRESLRERVGNYLAKHSDLYHRRPTRYDTKLVLGEFEAFVSRRAKRQPMLQNVSRDDVAEYLRYKVDQGRAPATANRHLRSVRAFLRWCVGREWIVQDPSRGIRPLKIIRRRPPIPEVSDVRRLLDYLKERRDSLYSSLVQVAANTGLRLGELVHLRPGDIDLERRLLSVRNDEGHGTKDNEERAVPLNARAYVILRYWLAWRRDHPAALIFFDPAPRTVGWLSRALKRRTRAAGVPNVTWYSLRHLFATTLAGKVPELVLAAIMGHSDPRTTRRWYVHRAAMSIDAPPVI